MCRLEHKKNTQTIDLMFLIKILISKKGMQISNWYNNHLECYSEICTNKIIKIIIN